MIPETDFLHVDVNIFKSDAEDSPALRSFNADVHAFVMDSSTPEEEVEDMQKIAEVGGWLSWYPHGDIWESADAISSEAVKLAAGFNTCNGDGELEFVAAILLVRMITVVPECRGQRLVGKILQEVMDTLMIDPDGAAVFLVPEPQQAGGGPYPEGTTGDTAMRKLRATYTDYGFIPVSGAAGETVWWLPPLGWNPE